MNNLLSSMQKGGYRYSKSKSKKIHSKSQKGGYKSGSYSSAYKKQYRRRGSRRHKTLKRGGNCAARSAY